MSKPDSGGDIQTSVTYNNPHPFDLATRGNLITSANNLLNQPGPYYPPFDLVAPRTPQQEMAGALGTAIATDPASYNGLALGQMAADYASSPAYWNTASNLLDSASTVLDPNMLYVTTNPYLQDAMYAAMAPTITQFQTQVMPQISNDAEMAGQYGGSRQGVAEGAAAAGVTNALAGIGADMAYQNYSDAQDRMIRGMEVAPNAMTAPILGLGAASDTIGMGLQQAYNNVTMLDTIGVAQQQHAQNMIDAEVTRWLYNNEMPLQKLQLYGSIVNGTPSMGGSTSVNQPAPQSDPLMSAAGGAIAGWQLAAGTALGGPAGAALGAIAGLILGG